MITKAQYRLLYVYQFFRSLRYTLLTSVFGIVSHCKHSPTCGTYFFTSMTKYGVIKGGFKGGFKGIKRVLSCW